MQIACQRDFSLSQQQKQQQHQKYILLSFRTFINFKCKAATILTLKKKRENKMYHEKTILHIILFLTSFLGVSFGQVLNPIYPNNFK